MWWAPNDSKKGAPARWWHWSAGGIVVEALVGDEQRRASKQMLECRLPRGRLLNGEAYQGMRPVGFGFLKHSWNQVPRRIQPKCCPAPGQIEGIAQARSVCPPTAVLPALRIVAAGEQIDGGMCPKVADHLLEGGHLEPIILGVWVAAQVVGPPVGGAGNVLGLDTNAFLGGLDECLPNGIAERWSAGSLLPGVCRGHGIRLQDEKTS